MDSLVTQIVENFKAAYGLKITDSGDLFLTERNLLEFLMKLGRQAMSEVSKAWATAMREPSCARGDDSTGSSATAGGVCTGCLG